MTLFRLIFCSPFRILGEEGIKREKDWNRHFAPGKTADTAHLQDPDKKTDGEETSGYKWPMPTAVSEKFRYETCEAALDALTKPSSPDGPLRSSFVKNQGPFHEQFFEMIEDYVEVTEKREQDLSKFLTETTRMWLVFSTQRYRIRMILPGSSESNPEKKMKLAQDGGDLEFTVLPMLQRHGNAQGAQLQEVSVISGFDGKVGTVHGS